VTATWTAVGALVVRPRSVRQLATRRERGAVNVAVARAGGVVGPPQNGVVPWALR
jgi:hypothetical protein